MTVHVRYIVDDVETAVAFYTTHLGFASDMAAPGFARLRRDDLVLLLNRPGAGGAGAEVAGQSPRPGGWARFQLRVDDLHAEVARLEAAGVTLRGGLVEGRGGDQVLVEDPSGNVVELFEPR
jgi:catechol 2,3-dioxygenase-like lactoylglutathione lyase family enzyme